MTYVTQSLRKRCIYHLIVYIHKKKSAFNIWHSEKLHDHVEHAPGLGHSVYCTRISWTRRHVNTFAGLIEIYVLIHSRIEAGMANKRARASRRRWTTGEEERTRGDTGRRDGTRCEREGRRINEERVRGRVISFLCLLLIYSDAPRLSASGANKFLEPPRQLDTPLPAFFFPTSNSLSTLFPSARTDLPQRRDIPAALNSPRRRRVARHNAALRKSL